MTGEQYDAPNQEVVRAPAKGKGKGKGAAAPPSPVTAAPAKGDAED